MASRARQFLVNQLRPSDFFEKNALPQYGNGTTAWLPILHELEQLRLPLKFSKLVGRGIEYVGSESAVVNYREIYKCCTALTSYVMKRGVHYASFKFRGNAAIMGDARPFRNFDFVNEEDGFDITFNFRHFGSLLLQRTDSWVGNVHCCQIDSYGEVHWTDLQEHNDEEGFGGFDDLVCWLT